MDGIIILHAMRASEGNPSYGGLHVGLTAHRTGRAAQQWFGLRFGDNAQVDPDYRPHACFWLLILPLGLQTLSMIPLPRGSQAKEGSLARPSSHWRVATNLLPQSGPCAKLCSSPGGHCCAALASLLHWH